MTRTELSAMTVEQLLEGYSDAHKDLCGWRPRHTPSHEELVEFWDTFDVNFQTQKNIEEQQDAEGLARFEADVAKALEVGATDRATAIRWMLDGENVDMDNRQSVEHFFWCYGMGVKNMERITEEVLGPCPWKTAA